MPEFFNNIDPILMVGASLVISLGLLLVIVRARKKPAGQTSVSEHSIPTNLLTATELQALSYLRSAVKGTAYICPKVHIANIIGQAAASQAAPERYVDFAAMGPGGQFLFAVELDAEAVRYDNLSAKARKKNLLFKQADRMLIRVLPGKLERSDELEFAISQTLANRGRHTQAA